MTDRIEGLLEPAKQALLLQQVQHDHEMLAQRVTSGMENVTNTLGNVQLEVRALSQGIRDLAGLQHAHDANKESIDEMKRTVGELSTRLEGWFDDFDERNNKRWEAHEADRNAWRREHEAENEDAMRALSGEIRSVRETVIRVIAIGSALGTLSGVIVAGFLWNVNFRFDATNTSIYERKEASSYNRSLYDKLNDQMVEVQLYLARGGRIPEEPFVPKRENNGTANHTIAPGQPGK